MSGGARFEEAGVGAAGFAFLAVTSSTGLILILRGTMSVWPVGLAGALSRVVSVGLLLFWVGARGEGWRRLRPRGAGKAILLMGTLSIALNLCLFAGSQWTSATNAVLLWRSDLLFVLLIGALMGLESVSGRGWVVVALMVVGLGLLMEVQSFDWRGHARGDLLIVLSALGLAVNAFVIRGILGRMDGEALAVYNHAISGLGFVALLFFEGARLPARVLARPEEWWWIAALGVTASLSLPLYYAALGRLPVWKLRALMLLSVPFGALLDRLLWGVVLSAGQWCGAVMLVGGAAALGRMERPPSDEGSRSRLWRARPRIRAWKQSARLTWNAPMHARSHTPPRDCRSLADE